jgi:hypothetical protein
MNSYGLRASSVDGNWSVVALQQRSASAGGQWALSAWTTAVSWTDRSHEGPLGRLKCTLTMRLSHAPLSNGLRCESFGSALKVTEHSVRT